MITCSDSTRDESNNCECKQGFFEDSSNNNPVCEGNIIYYFLLFFILIFALVCNRKCGSCRSNGDCEVTCDSSCARCGLDSLCTSCNLGQFLNPANKLCEDCHPKCDICDPNDKNQCL